MMNQFTLAQHTITLPDILDGVDALMNRVNAADDPRPIITEAVSSLLGMQKLSGIALAKFLWSVNQGWRGDEEFSDFLHGTVGMQRVVIDRYISVWDMFVNGAVPQDVAPTLLQQPMKCLISAATAVSQGYEISEDGWKLIAASGNESAVRGVIREEKGTKPRSNSLTLYLQRDGSLQVWSGDGQVFNIGYLNNADDQPEPVKRALTRICNGAGVIIR